jgi:uncharacterized membrane protein HdeD (DUF308 family)
MATVDMTAPRPSAASDFWWLPLLQGIAALIVGILLLTNPAATLVTLVIFLGVYWFIGGIFEIVSLFLDRTHWGWKLVSGILGILAGIVIVQNPLWSAILVPATLVWILGIFGIIIGAIELFRAVQGAGWGVGILGVISIILGLILLGGNPLVATIVLVYVAAIWAIIGGLAAIIYAFRLRSS